MAVNATYDTALNANYGIESGIARGIKFATGTIKATYSSAGGLTWTLPFVRTLYVQIPEVSNYFFVYDYTSTMLHAYEYLATTTAAGHPQSEVASDTDFTTTSLADHIRFVAFGF